MDLPLVDHAALMHLLQPPEGSCDVVIDTDTYNEIDDQFAIVHALLSDRINVETIQAAPFHAEVRNTTSHEHGMELSYDEIHRVLERMPIPFDGPVCKGARTTMSATGHAVASPAVDNLVQYAMADRTGPLYVLALGALTNIASGHSTSAEILPGWS